MNQPVTLSIVGASSVRRAHPNAFRTPHRAAYVEATRQLPCGVSVVSFPTGSSFSGVTATSVTSLSIEPPTLLVCLEQACAIPFSTATGGLFGVSVLGAGHAELAARHSSASPIGVADDGPEGGWRTTPEGVPLRSDAVAALECEWEDSIERFGRVIVIGRVRSVFVGAASGALVSWRGSFSSIGWTDEEIRCAVGLRSFAL